MLVCLCQSFKQLVANDRTTNFLLLASTRATTTRGSVFSLCFFLFSLFCLLYRFIFYTNYLGIVLIFRFVCSWLFSPLTSQRLWFLLFLNYTPLFIRQKCNLQAPSLRFHFIQVEMRETFFPTAQTSLSPFLSRSLSLYPPLERFSRNDSAYTERRERDRLPKKSPSLFFFLPTIFYLGRRDNFFFFF